MFEEILDFHLATPDDPDGSLVAVFAMYGVTMSAVQGTEGAIASLALVSSHKPPSDLTQRRFVAKIPHEHKSAADKFNSSGGTKLSELQGRIPDELLAEISAWVGDRNFFAHRFFKKQFGDGRFHPGTMEWLSGFHDQTGQMSSGIHAYIEEVTKDWPDPEDFPLEWREWSDAFAQSVVHGGPMPELPLEPKQP